ncbi:hypothetical protein MP638_004435 [Amoeboaphelidium occidentale]|nr:hypothetical protein MP638_004435 [Amoeboaphelidium occidentale]
MDLLTNKVIKTMQGCHRKAVIYKDQFMFCEAQSTISLIDTVSGTVEEWLYRPWDYEKRISVMLVRNETLIIGTSNGKVEYYDIPTKNLTRVFEPVGYWIDIFENEIFTQTDSTKCYESYDLYSHEFLKRYCSTAPLYFPRGSYVIDSFFLIFRQQVAVFDRNSTDLLYTLDGHFSGVEGRIEDFISSVTHHGQYLYTGGQDGLIKKWNLKSGVLEMTFYKHYHYVLVIVVESGRVYSISQSISEGLKIWNDTTGEIIYAFPSYEYPVVSLAVYDNVIYSSLGTGTVTAYGRKDFVFLRRYEAFNFFISCNIIVDSDGLFSAAGQAKVAQISLDTGLISRIIFVNSNAITCLSKSENNLIIGAERLNRTQKAITVWDLTANVESDIDLSRFSGVDKVAVATFFEDKIFVAGAVEQKVVVGISTNDDTFAFVSIYSSYIYALSVNSYSVFAGGAKNPVNQWSFDGFLLNTFDAHSSDEFFTNIRATETHLYTGSSNGLVSVFSLVTNSRILSLRGHAYFITGIEVIENLIYTSSEDTTVKVWNLDTGRISYTIADDSQSVTCLGAANSMVAVGTLSGSVKIFNSNTSSIVKSIENDSGVTSLSLINGSHTVFTTSSGYIYRQQLSSDLLESINTVPDIRRFFHYSSVHTVFTTSSGYIYRQQLSSDLLESINTVPDIRRFFHYSSVSLAISGNSTILHWQNEALFSQPRIIISEYHTKPIQTACVSGDYLFTAGKDNFIGQWNFVSEVLERTFIGHTDEISCLCADRNFLFSGSADTTIRKWLISTGQVSFVYRNSGRAVGHLGPVSYIIMYNGFLASASEDKTVKLWDIYNDRLVGSYADHQRSVTSLATDGIFLFSGSADAVVYQYYKLPFDDPVLSSSRTTSFSTSRPTVAPVVPLQPVSQSSNLNITLIVILLVVVLVLVAIAAGIKTRAACLDPILQKNGTSESLTKTIDASTSFDLMTFSKFAATEMTLVTKNQKVALPLYNLFSSVDFEIMQKIGQGGSGIVYVGNALTPTAAKYGKKIVIKTFGGNITDLHQGLATAFKQEVSLMTALEHERNIAKIVGYCEKPCCILMKFYPHGSLDNWLKRNRPSSVFKTMFLKDIATGLQAIHRAFAHCDLKTANVLVDESDRLFCVITDFGITRILSWDSVASKAFTPANLTGFSLLHAAPEVFLRFKGRANLIDSAVVIKSGDIYALALIIYEFLVSKKPWIDTANF